MGKHNLALLLYLLLQAFAAAQENPQISITSEETTLHALISHLARDHGFVISYSPDRVDHNQRVYLEIREYKLSDLLHVISQQLELDIQQHGKRILLRRQKVSDYIKLAGQLQDGDGSPVPFANVFLESTQIGTFSDESGRFILKGIPSETRYKLVASAVGYTTNTQIINASEATKPVIITLSASFIELEPIEVTTGSYTLLDLSTGKSAINKNQIENSPNLIKDIFRTINLIPSVSNTDYSVRPRIRGGNHHETGIYLDGFELINPFHLEVGGGVQGLFNTDYVESVKVYPGAFSAKYADRLSGIVELATPNFFENNEFSLSLDLLNAIASTKLKLRKNVYFLSSIRRGYWDFLIDLEEYGTSLSFYDSWSKVIFRPSDNQLLTFNLLYGKDYFDYENSNRDIVINSHTSNHDKLYSWLNWKVNINPRFFKQSTFGYQRLSKQYDFVFESSISNGNVDNSDFEMLSLNEYFEYEISDSQHVSFGGEYRYISNNTLFQETRYDIHESTATNPVVENIDVDTHLKGHMYGLYGEYIHRFGKLTAKSSIRASGQSFSEKLQLAPRLNVDYKVADELNIGLGYGMFNQPDQFYDLRSELNQSDLSARNAKAIHYTANLTYERPKTSLRLDLYHKVYKRLFDDFRFTPTERIESFKTFERTFNTVSGEASGFEILLNHHYGRHVLNMNYAYSISTIKNDLGEKTSRSLEIPHNFTFNNLFNFKNHFSISTSLIIRSGSPFSEVTSTDGITVMDGIKPVVFYELNGTNNRRYSSYQTFDVRVSKKWLNKKTTFEAYLNFLNLFNASNIRNRYFNPSIQGDGSLFINENLTIFFPIFVTPGFKVTF